MQQCLCRNDEETPSESAQSTSSSSSRSSESSDHAFDDEIELELFHDWSQSWRIPTDLLCFVHQTTRKEVGAMLRHITVVMGPIVSKISPATGVQYAPLIDYEEQCKEMQVPQNSYDIYAKHL
jgi:hypothetical protein